MSAAFAALHVPGEPLVLYNCWDPGSAQAAVRAGARAVATGSASVAGALGYGDGEAVPLDLVLDNAARIVRAVDVPVTIDFEGGYAIAPDAVAANVRRLTDTGAVGCNLEDQVVGGDGLHPVETQAARLVAIRAAVGPDFFVNARTDLFLKAPRDAHDAALIDAAVARAAAYAAAGASGIFAPGLFDPTLIADLCRRVTLPVNIMASPTTPDRATLAALGVARISHGPFPWMAAMTGYEAGLRAAMA